MVCTILCCIGYQALHYHTGSDNIGIGQYVVEGMGQNTSLT